MYMVYFTLALYSVSRYNVLILESKFFLFFQISEISRNFLSLCGRLKIWKIIREIVGYRQDFQILLQKDFDQSLVPFIIVLSRKINALFSHPELHQSLFACHRQHPDEKLQYLEFIRLNTIESIKLKVVQSQEVFLIGHFFKNSAKSTYLT